MWNNNNNNWRIILWISEILQKTLHLLERDLDNSICLSKGQKEIPLLHRGGTQGTNAGTKGLQCGWSAWGWQCPGPVLLHSEGTVSNHRWFAGWDVPALFSLSAQWARRDWLWTATPHSHLAWVLRSMLRCSCRSCCILSPAPIFASFHPARFDMSPAIKRWCSRAPHILTSLTGPHTLRSASFLQALLGIYSLLLLPVFPWQPDLISASGIIFMKKFSYSSPVCPWTAHASPTTSPKPSMILQAWIISTSPSPFHCLWWNFSKCINSFIQQGWARGSPLCWRGGFNFSFSHLSPSRDVLPSTSVQQLLLSLHCVQLLHPYTDLFTQCELFLTNNPQNKACLEVFNLPARFSCCN